MILGACTILLQLILCGIRGWQQVILSYLATIFSKTSSPSGIHRDKLFKLSPFEDNSSAITLPIISPIF
jgi:hypothetical protein